MLIARCCCTISVDIPLFSELFVLEILVTTGDAAHDEGCAQILWKRISHPFSSDFKVLVRVPSQVVKGTGTTSAIKDPSLYSNYSKLAHIGHGFGGTPHLLFQRLIGILSSVFSKMRSPCFTGLKKFLAWCSRHFFVILFIRKLFQ